MCYRFRPIHLQRTQGGQIISAQRQASNCCLQGPVPVFLWAQSFRDGRIPSISLLRPLLLLLGAANAGGVFFYWLITDFSGALKWILNSFWLPHLLFSLRPDKCQSVQSLWIQLQKVSRCSTNSAFQNRYHFSLGLGNGKLMVLREAPGGSDILPGDAEGGHPGML